MKLFRTIERWVYYHIVHYIRVFLWDIRDFLRQPKYDVYFQPGGLYAITPLTPEGLDWILDNVYFELSQTETVHGAILSEPSYALDIAYALQEEGYKINLKLQPV